MQSGQPDANLDLYLFLHPKHSQHKILPFTHHIPVGFKVVIGKKGATYLSL